MCYQCFVAMSLHVSSKQLYSYVKPDVEDFENQMPVHSGDRGAMYRGLPQSRRHSRWQRFFRWLGMDKLGGQRQSQRKAFLNPITLGF